MYTLITLAERYYYLAKQAYIKLTGEYTRQIREVLKNHYQLNGHSLFPISEEDLLTILNSILPLDIKVINHHLPKTQLDDYGNQVCYLQIGMPSFQDLPLMPISSHKLKVTVLEERDNQLVVIVELVSNI